MGCPFSLYSMSKSQGFQRTTFLHQVENPHKTPHPPWLFRNELLLDPKADPSLPQSVLLHAILLFHCLTCLLAWSATKLHDHHGIMRRDREAPLFGDVRSWRESFESRAFSSLAQQLGKCKKNTGSQQLPTSARNNNSIACGTWTLREHWIVLPRNSNSTPL